MRSQLSICTSTVSRISLRSRASSSGLRTSPRSARWPGAGAAASGDISFQPPCASTMPSPGCASTGTRRRWSAGRPRPAAGNAGAGGCAGWARRPRKAAAAGQQLQDARRVVAAAQPVAQHFRQRLQPRDAAQVEQDGFALCARRARIAAALGGLHAEQHHGGRIGRYHGTIGAQQHHAVLHVVDHQPVDQLLQPQLALARRASCSCASWRLASRYISSAAIMNTSP